LKIKVLVIDDDEDVLFLAKKFLMKEDDRFELVSVNTDQEALQILEEEDFDAIVCDHYLGPHSMTGLDLLEWVRETHPHIPFIILTGRSQEAVAIRALNLGANFYLKKGSQDIKDLFSQIAYQIKTEVESRRTDEALEVAYNELEVRVKQRTAELEEINRQLVHEISERKKVEAALLLQRDLGNILCKTRDLAKALDHILNATLHLEDIDCGGIYLGNSSNSEFNLLSSSGISSQFLNVFSGKTKPQSISKPIYLDVKRIRRKELDKEYKDIKAVAIIPVLVDNRPRAILSFCSRSLEDIPTRNRHTLEAIAIQIGAFLTRIDAELALSPDGKNRQ